jgi:hypothetical protein
VAIRCDNNKTPSDVGIEDTTQVLSSELPEGFHDFYDQFHSDSVFQMEHIVFPLKGEMIKKDSMETLSLEKVYEASTWKLHKPFKQEGGFSRNFTVMGDLVIEQMVDNMGLYTVERRWGLVDTTWSLIYYGTSEKTW